MTNRSKYLLSLGICLGSFLIQVQPSLAATILAGPYIQRVSEEAATLRLVTQDVVQLDLNYRQSGDTHWQTLSETKAKTTHRFRVTDLDPNHTYEYYWSHNNQSLTRTNTFRTVHVVSGTDPLRFVYFGDSGHYNNFALQLAAQMEDWQPDMIVHGGDNAYEHGTLDQYYTEFFDPFSTLIADAAFYPTIGNHDYIVKHGRPYKELFEVPQQNSGSEDYYSFDYDTVHFVTVNNELSTDPGSEQYEWLEADLAAASDAQWIVVWMHYPMYNSGIGNVEADEAEQDLVSTLAPLFEQYDVDVALTSHAHYYERNKKVHGLLTLVSGGGGAVLSQPATNNPYSAFQKSIYHFLGVTITPHRLRIQAIDYHGHVFDHVNVRK